MCEGSGVGTTVVMTDRSQDDLVLIGVLGKGTLCLHF